MLQDIYDLLLLHRVEPRWVDGEVHVEVHGRAFALSDYPGGVAVRTLAVRDSAILRHPDDALAALGLV
jgi:hypothetical protein